MNSHQKVNLENRGLDRFPSKLLAQVQNCTTLNLARNRILLVPASVGTLETLQKLDLRCNQLSTLPSEFTMLRQLAWLNLSSNHILDLPTNFSAMLSLRHLNLASNTLQELPADFGQLRSLEKLDLSDNGLVSLPRSFGNLSRLQVLDLSSNSLMSIPSDIGGLRRLTKLALNSNSLSGLPPSMGSLRRLRDLNLNNNKLTSLPRELGRLPRIKSLQVQGNPLASIPLEVHQVLWSLLQRDIYVPDLQNEKPRSCSSPTKRQLHNLKVSISPPDDDMGGAVVETTDVERSPRRPRRLSSLDVILPIRQVTTPESKSPTRSSEILRNSMTPIELGVCALDILDDFSRDDFSREESPESPVILDVHWRRDSLAGSRISDSGDTSWNTPGRMGSTSPPPLDIQLKYFETHKDLLCGCDRKRGCVCALGPPRYAGTGMSGFWLWAGHIDCGKFLLFLEVTDVVSDLAFFAAIRKNYPILAALAVPVILISMITVCFKTVVDVSLYNWVENEKIEFLQNDRAKKRVEWHAWFSLLVLTPAEDIPQIIFALIVLSQESFDFTLYFNIVCSICLLLFRSLYVYLVIRGYI